MYKEWTSEDILKRRHYADLGEYGEFTADTRKPLEIISTRQVVVKGTYTYNEKQEEKELFIELDDALTEEEIESLSAGEIFIKGWRDFTF